MSNIGKTLIPLFNRILVKKFAPISQTQTGVVIPENRASRNAKATVIAVGTGERSSAGSSVPCCLKKGDVVLLPDYGGTRVPGEEKQEYFIYRECDILAKIEE